VAAGYLGCGELPLPSLESETLTACAPADQLLLRVCSCCALPDACVSGARAKCRRCQAPRSPSWQLESAIT